MITDFSFKLVLRWTRGSPGAISLSEIKAMICQIMDPNGITVVTSINKCYYEVKVATVQHEGIWLARYNTDDEMLEPIEQKFRLEILGKISL